MKFHYGPVLLAAALTAPLGCAESNQPQAPQQPVPGTQKQPATPDAGQPPAGQPPAGQQSNQPFSNPDTSGPASSANSDTEPPTFDANRIGSTLEEESPTARPNSGLPTVEEREDPVDSPATGISFGKPNDGTDTATQPARRADIPDLE
jgi:hypothetical protein